MVCWDGNSSKANGSVQICVDFSRLNDSVCRERHPLPVMEQVLAQLTGAKLFSKLDASPTVDSGRSHYHQNLLYSQHLSHHLGGSVSSANIWHHNCPRTFSKMDALNSLRCRGSPVRDG